jgi:hypothetical protein
MVSGPQRLAAIAGALEEVGLTYLVMGGHAVRYYGVDRNTVDYDLHLSLEPSGDWERLGERLQRATLFSNIQLVEGQSWRPAVFRRFLLGRLADGREEWLEFWRTNHLLAPFSELAARQERGEYGGRILPFLGLSDLIRSKETERGSDWQDLVLLEEIRDARNLARATEEAAAVAALAELRSRSGFHLAMQRGLLGDTVRIATGLGRASSAITRGYLLPFLPAHEFSSPNAGMIGEILSGPLRQVGAGSPKHEALVEAIRRLYKQAAIEADRADKAAALGQ